MPPSTTRARRRAPAAALPIVAALLLAGCVSSRGLAPQLTPTDADTLVAGRSLAGTPLSAAGFPRGDWWTAFGDPQLDALIIEALRDSPTLAAADARARSAQAQAGLADAQRRPTLGASARVSGVRLPETIAPDPVGGDFKASGVLMLDFAWAPDLWGGQRAAFEAAAGQARAAEVDAQAARLTLSSNVARTYVALAQAFDAQDVAQREIDRATRLRDLARQRVEAGLDNQLQLRNADTAIGIARQQAQAAQQQIDALRNALAALLGKGPDRGLDVARPRLLQASAPSVPAVLPSELLGHRADVVAARWRVEAAARGVDAAQAAFRPSVNLSALVGLAAGSLSDLFGSDAVLGFGGPALSLPIFDGGRLRAGLAQRDADYDAAVAAYDQTLVAALREVADALQAARALDAQIGTVADATEAARQAFSLADTRYRAGIGNQLDVLAAQRPLFQLEQQLATLRAQRLGAAVDLDRALGGGLTPAAPSPSTQNQAGATTP
ncbi:efflux transporter outer membrane subunit [Luteimonas sp. FCS-9]|uniref:efflux transporter outer membrane subunit n=1 Tax=Luteimonas sp. FCS-9 TaxID=1547516 RepID=UPI00063EB830|nr:efflux transporter outer membrane subunit [Luteimonas sp. FCS-9]KLJ01426.1 multidrug RND transporter [Luteimonas sp. FCS-9]